MPICAARGEYNEPPILEGAGPAGLVAVCPHCHHREPFAQYPLWWITGSPGVGKSTLAPLLRRGLPEWIVFEGEAIDFWRYEERPGDYAALHSQYLKVAYEIASNDRPVVLLATASPADVDASPFRSRFAAIGFLGLVSDPATQERRLRARPAWRRADTPEGIARALGYTAHLRELARRDPGAMALHDTTTLAAEESADRIAA